MKLRSQPAIFKPKAGLVGPGGESLTPKVALGYPFGGGVTGAFLQSLLRLQAYELSKERPLLHHLIPQQGLYIAQNRNVIAEKFLKTGADWLCQIDSDIQFPPQLLEMLLAVAGRDKKIVAASVPLSYSEDHGKNLPSCGLMIFGNPGLWEYVEADLVTEEGVQVDGVATAVCIIHREVFEAIADREGRDWFLHMNLPKLDTEESRSAWADGGNVSQRAFTSVGEDLAFCLRAKAAGYPSWVAKMPGLRHLKTMPLSHDYEVDDASAAEPQAVAQ